METKHTPGPWKYRPAIMSGFYVETVDQSHDNSFIGEVGGGLQSKQEIIANAKLVAAAPDLLEALNECIAALKYAAFNDDGSKLENLPAGIMDSTGVSATCLIAVRNSLEAIKKATE